MAKITPLVRDKLLTYNNNSTIPVDSPAWWLWLHAPTTSNFRFEQGRMSFTARREQKGGGFYWYAYRKQQGRLRKTYLGRGEELTWERMENAARALSHAEQERGEASTSEPTPTQQVECAAAITSAPLLTKLSLPPARHELVARLRLYTRLDQALTRKLTLISAPAGFGKTTLVSAWRASRQDALSLAWLALDEGDNDPARFWNCMAAALQSIQPGLGAHLATLLQLAPTQWPPMEAILTVLINALTNITHDVVLALDDYHLISTQAIHKSMAFLLEHQPPHLHLIVRRLLASFSESAQVQAQESSDLFLSERERDVLRLLAAGQSNQQIADAFVVARSTVKTHLNNIYPEARRPQPHPGHCARQRTPSALMWCHKVA